MKEPSRIPESWKPHFVTELDTKSTLVSDFERHLLDATDEKPLQTFLQAHPSLLTPLLPLGRGAWLWDRPKFGAEFIPDFLLCTRNSAGCHWVMVELESPTAAPLLRSGLSGPKLREAQGQINNWRIWLRDNIGYAQNQHG